MRVGRCGKRLRAGTGVKVLGGGNIILGDEVSILGDTTLAAIGGSLQIGDRVAMNRHVHIDASQAGKILVGSSVLIGPNVVLRASDHSHERTDIPIRDQGHTGGWIIVEEGVWLAANVVVTRNVRIGAHSIVAAGAVVVKDIPPFSVAAGVPARVLCSRNGVARP
jgi:galactoside O-acetyltransferase